jgi:protein gp37
VGDKTKIEWTDASWNPVTGCTKVSAGCTNCYAERMAKRLAGRAGYPSFDPRANGPVGDPFAVTLRPDRLNEPLRWRKPRRVFVCSMSDLFHKDVPDEFIDRVFAVMADCPRHTFQVLTKRPERMVAYLSHTRGDGNVLARVLLAAREMPKQKGWVAPGSFDWPLPNVWLGTSIENQATAGERIPHLLRCPAAVRFVSYEPAIAPVSFRWMRAWEGSSRGSALNPAGSTNEYDGLRKLDWIIAGGESGPHARPCSIEWIRSVVEQCRAAGVPVFVKQLGRWPSSNQPECESWEPLWEDKTCTRLSGRYAPYGGLSHKGGNPSEWPEDLRVQEFPKVGG